VAIAVNCGELLGPQVIDPACWFAQLRARDG
jgi:hypothetical protein